MDPRTQELLDRLGRDLTARDFRALALACLDQGGVPVGTQDRICAVLDAADGRNVAPAPHGGESVARVARSKLDEQVDVLVAVSRQAGRSAAEVAAQEHRVADAHVGYPRAEATRELRRRRDARDVADARVDAERARLHRILDRSLSR